MKEDLKKLLLLKDHDSIKVIMSHRRSGKTRLLSVFREALLKLGVKSSNIIYKNFEINTLPLNTSLSLYIKKLTTNENDYCLIFDEITELNGWEREIKTISENKKIHIFLSSSNKYIYTKEFIRLFKDKYTELYLYPMSFKEYLNNIDEKEDLKEILKSYINKNEYKENLIDTYSSIILNDVLKKNYVRDINLLEGVIKYILNHIGCLTSAKKISDYLKRQNLKASVDTIYLYIDMLINANFIYKLNRYDLKNKTHLKTLEKYYLTNINFRNVLLKRESVEFDSILENMIYIELLRRGNVVYIGKYKDKLVDFVAVKNNERRYYQVVLKESNKKAKYETIKSISDSFPKYILSMEEEASVDENGIKKENIINFLTE